MTEGEGRIVNISSIIASTGYSGLSVYGATKAAMLGFTRSLAREVGRLGITVNAVAPGFMDTEMTRSMAAGQRAKIAVARRPEAPGGSGGRGRQRGVSDVDAAKNITGTVTDDGRTPGNTA